jgi:hypothetical protein
VNKIAKVTRRVSHSGHEMWKLIALVIIISLVAFIGGLGVYTLTIAFNWISFIITAGVTFVLLCLLDYSMQYLSGKKGRQIRVYYIRNFFVSVIISLLINSILVFIGIVLALGIIALAAILIVLLIFAWLGDQLGVFVEGIWLSFKEAIR